MLNYSEDSGTKSGNSGNSGQLWGNNWEYDLWYIHVIQFILLTPKIHETLQATLDNTLEYDLLSAYVTQSTLLTMKMFEKPRKLRATLENTWDMNPL